MEQVVNTTVNDAVAAVESDRSTLRTRMLRGSVILLFSTGLVSATNLLYNIAIARGLGAAGFGHATAIYTLLMLLSAVTLAYQHQQCIDGGRMAKSRGPPAWRNRDVVKKIGGTGRTGAEQQSDAAAQHPGSQGAASDSTAAIASLTVVFTTCSIGPIHSTVSVYD